MPHSRRSQVKVFPNGNGKGGLLRDGDLGAGEPGSC